MHSIVDSFDVILKSLISKPDHPPIRDTPILLLGIWLVRLFSYGTQLNRSIAMAFVLV